MDDKAEAETKKTALAKYYQIKILTNFFHKVDILTNNMLMLMLPTSQQKELKSNQLPDSFEASRTTNHQSVIQEWPEIPSFSLFIFTLIVF